MSKRRFNAKKIANTPSLKKAMARFCAHVDIEFTEQKPNYAELLYKGHRGYISYSEDDLAKEFDKRLEIVRSKYSVMKANEDKRANDRWYRKSDQFAEVELWYEEAVDIANQIFEEQFLS